MQKTILITGATDGIGLETAKSLVALGHNVLLHGRNPQKLEKVEKLLTDLSGAGAIKSYVADLSILKQAKSLAGAVIESNTRLDVLINNAGVFKVPDAITADGLDVRFAVNTLAPYVLTRCLMPLLKSSARVVNVSSAAQAPVDIKTMSGEQTGLDDMAAYAQSKLAITMWSRSMALSAGDDGPLVVAVNPGSMLGSKMVKEAFGADGGDLQIGADILTRAAVSDEFENASGKYFDNDLKQFASPHADALDEKHCDQLVQSIETIVADKTG